jgi:hypothetical protein
MLGAAGKGLAISPAVFPSLRDIVLISDGGLVRSAWGGPVNASATLGIGRAADMAQFAVEVAERSAAADASARAGPLQLMLSGGEMIVLVFTAALSATTRISIGGHMAILHWVSADSKVFAVTAPASTAVCGTATSPGSTSASCGYVPLALDSDDPVQANLTCPPFCPGVLPGTVPFTGQGGQLTLVYPSAAPGVPQGLPDPVDLRGVTAGIYYTATCAQAGYTDPATGVCANASDPRAALCGFGAGSECSPCPKGALCPGGRRVWPLPGYYTSSEDSADVIQCPAPSARCAGWSTSLGAVGCAPGYGQGSYGCIACASGYYTDATAACSACPDGIDAWAIARPLLIFAGALLAVAAVLYGALVTVARCVGGTVAGGAWRMTEFTAWAVTVVQLVGQVSQAASTGLPEFARTAYAAINVFQFVGVALPPACIGGYPFTGQAVQFGLVLALMLCTLALLPKIRQGTAARLQATARRVLVRPLFTALLLLYPGVTNAALGLLSCTHAVLPRRVYESLDHRGGTGGQSSGGGADAVSLSVLDANPYYVCYEGTHGTIAPVAWLVLVVYVVAYPVGTFLWVRHRLAVLTRGGDSAGAVQGVKGLATDIDSCDAVLKHPTLVPFTAGDYRAAAFWFRHVDLAALAALSCLLVLWLRPASVAALACKAAATGAVSLTVSAVLWRVRPYPPHAQWKLKVRTVALALTASAAAANAAGAAGASAAAVVALGSVVAGLSAVLVITLFVAFCASAIDGARREKEKSLGPAASALGQVAPRTRRGALSGHLPGAGVTATSAPGQVAPRTRRGALSGHLPGAGVTATSAPLRAAALPSAAWPNVVNPMLRAPVRPTQTLAASTAAAAPHHVASVAGMARAGQGLVGPGWQLTLGSDARAVAPPPVKDHALGEHSAGAGTFGINPLWRQGGPPAVAPRAWRLSVTHGPVPAVAATPAVLPQRAARASRVAFQPLRPAQTKRIHAAASQGTLAPAAQVPRERPHMTAHSSGDVGGVRR